ncbi:hypothetical protein [Salinibius halmophilus]|uniref:hypothetical protein n=1 Tax=Salinibius halmophilus TaxID=1853216 RepID=UPI000E66C8FB|nr:hypothetical protein [Salinibius halmophilus]
MASVAVLGGIAGHSLQNELASIDWLAFDDAVDDFDVLLVADFPGNPNERENTWKKIADFRATHPHTPVVLHCKELINDADRHEAFMYGADEVLHAAMPIAEQAIRLKRLIDDEVAAKQLRLQAQTANQVAMQAMSNSSDLGETIQFFLDSQDCENLDILGMRFFQSVKNYGLSCSLQMRSEFITKNMEANGLHRQLESELLWELKDDGRYVDFGRRTVMNYQKVSVLVRNMPEENEAEYGRIKDMMFSLLQALNARLEALDLQEKTFMQTKLLRQLVFVFSQRANQLNESVYRLVSDGAGQMSSLADSIEVGVGAIDMSEAQEAWLLGEIRQNEAQMNQLLSVALKSNEAFHRYVGLINNALEKATDTNKLQSLLQMLLDNDVE